MARTLDVVAEVEVKPDDLWPTFPSRQRSVKTAAERGTVRSESSVAESTSRNSACRERERERERERDQLGSTHTHGV